jgi:hypothetical protein
MMNAPDCPDHGRLALDLALGRLDDDAALEADEVRSSCPVCGGWWGAQFDGDTVAAVDHAVEAGLSDLELPARRPSGGWLAAAAVAVMAVGVATLWFSRPAAPVRPAPSSQVASIRSLDFEVPDELPEIVTTGVATSVTAVGENPTVVTDDREVVVASAPQATVSDDSTVPATAELEPLFTGGFETGDLGEWVPST